MHKFDFNDAKGKCGIYAIRNKKTGDRYVGQAKNIGERWRKHLRELKDGIKSDKLQNEWELYGAENFEFLILRECSQKHLDALEQAYINESGAYNKSAPMFFVLHVDMGSLSLSSGGHVPPDELTEEDLDGLTAFLGGELEEDDDYLEDDERLERTLDRNLSRLESLEVQKSTESFEKGCFESIKWLEDEGCLITRKLRRLHGDEWLAHNTTTLLGPFMLLADIYRKEKRYSDQIAILNRWQSFSKQESMPSHLGWNETLEKALSLAKKRYGKQNSG